MRNDVRRGVQFAFGFFFDDAEYFCIMFDDAVVGLDRIVIMGQVQIEECVASEGCAGDPVERYADFLRDDRRFGQRERHLASQPAVNGLFADIEDVHQQVREIRTLG